MLLINNKSNFNWYVKILQVIVYVKKSDSRVDTNWVDRPWSDIVYSISFRSRNKCRE